MIRTAACFALVFSPLALVAQSTLNASPASPQTTYMVLPAFEACPISMHATQGIWDRTVRVRDGEKEPVRPQPGQRISLNLRDSRRAPIVAATVQVRGMNGKNRMMLTPAGADQTWNAVTTPKIKFVDEKDGSFSADVRVPGFTAVSSIRLIDVSYADGTTWRSTASNPCRTQPDPLMLITER